MEETRPPVMEVTEALVRSAKKNGFDFGKDTAIVAAQHMLWQTVDLFRTIADLGVRTENIFVVGKVYSNAPEVISALRRFGITVIQTDTPPPGEFNKYFQRDVERLWEVAEHRLSRRDISRIIVLDDGGQSIANTPSELLQPYDVAGVEQTSSGMFIFEKRRPPYAVTSWARSAVKLRIEGPIFSHSLVNKINSEFLGGRVLRDKDVGIIGLGSIGRALAKLMVLQGNTVFFYDRDPNVLIPPDIHARITRLDSLEELMTRCNYVFGCSGRNPFNDKWPMKYRSGIKLFSGSGGDQEFGPIIRELRQYSRRTVDPNTWDIDGEGAYGPISIGYCGYPYNFMAHNGEPIPTRIVQIETGGLLASLIQARTYLGVSEHHDDPNANILRVAPEAQHFVYQTWLSAMAKHQINVKEKFAYDPAMLQAAGNIEWYEDNSEPHVTSLYRSVKRVEAAMSRLLMP